MFGFVWNSFRHNSAPWSPCLIDVCQHLRASVITPAYPGRWKKGQNDGNPCAYSEKPTSRRKFLGFPIFYRDFLYFHIFCYIFLRFPINGHPHIVIKHKAALYFAYPMCSILVPHQPWNPAALLYIDKPGSIERLTKAERTRTWQQLQPTITKNSLEQPIEAHQY